MFKKHEINDYLYAVEGDVEIVIRDVCTPEVDVSTIKSLVEATGKTAYYVSPAFFDSMLPPEKWG